MVFCTLVVQIIKIEQELRVKKTILYCQCFCEYYIIRLPEHEHLVKSKPHCMGMIKGKPKKYHYAIL